MRPEAVITLRIVLPAVKQAAEVRGAGFPALACPDALHSGPFLTHTQRASLAEKRWATSLMVLELSFF